MTFLHVYPKKDLKGNALDRIRETFDNKNTGAFVESLESLSREIVLIFFINCAMIHVSVTK